MFLCEECLKENFKNFGFPVSYGECELCKTPKPCADIPSNKLISKEK